jgi:hypothetical protein
MEFVEEVEVVWVVEVVLLGWGRSTGVPKAKRWTGSGRPYAVRRTRAPVISAASKIEGDRPLGAALARSPMTREKREKRLTLILASYLVSRLVC